MKHATPLEPRDLELWRNGYEAGYDDRDWCERQPGWMNAIVVGVLFGLGVLFGVYGQPVWRLAERVFF